MQTRLLFMILLLTGLLVRPSFAADSSSGDVSAEINPLTVHAGDKATLAVVLNVHPGLHAQSHTPRDEYAIKLEINPDKNPAVTFGDVKYPPGEDKTYPALGTLNVYEGKAVFEIPVQIKSDAKPGPLTLSGKLTFQACNEQSCFPPEDVQYSVKTTIVAAADATVANSSFPHDTPVHSSQAGPPDTGILAEFAGAFVIGMIFNLMPCVLPVLPLKIMGFYEASKHSRAKSLLLGGVFSIGLIASFAVLAALIVGSTKLEWGALFHYKWFTIAISTVLLVMAIGTFGAFNVNLPPAVYSITPRHDTILGNFLFGILTAILSTPCTFGVFAALLAWALRQTPFVGGSAIVMVGAGMAFPYFVLSAFPEVARKFPRTGPWAGVVKQVLGFLLLGTAIFFAQPLFPKGTTNYAWWSIFAMIAAGGVFFFVRTLQLSQSIKVRSIAWGVDLILVLVAFLFIYRVTYNPYNWIPYSEQSLAAAKASGKPVLVDFTADWCTTCHYIEGSVLNNPTVVKRVHGLDVVMIKADMTDNDAPGKPLLSKLTAANEIPLTLVFLPNSTEPKLLNGIYSTDDLLKTLGGSQQQ